MQHSLMFSMFLYFFSSWLMQEDTFSHLRTG